MVECVEVAGGRGVWVAGPARVRVVEGEVLAAGFVIGAGGEVLVRATRGFTFYAVGGGARVCVVSGRGGGYRLVEEGFGVTREWVGLGERLREAGYRRVVVVGPVEAGKSTLTVFLANILGLPVLEADVGQNELGLPGCVAYARPGGRFLSMEELEPGGCVFVGHVAVDRVAEAVVSAAARAAALLGSYVADTDGYVEQRGVVYKAWLVEAVGAEAVVSLGAPGELVGALRARGVEVLEAPRAPLPRWRSRLDRRSFRSRLWARLFAQARPVVLEGVPVEPLCPASRREGETVYSCGGHGEEVVEARRPRRGAASVRPGWWRGLVAGLRLRGGLDVPALVEGLDAASGRVVARPAWGVEPREVLGVRLGWIRLGENFVEEHLPVGPYPLPLLRRRGRRGGGGGEGG